MISGVKSGLGQPLGTRVVSFKGGNLLQCLVLVAPRVGWITVEQLKRCGPSIQETVQVTKGTAINTPGGCNLPFQDHKIYGEDSIRHAASDTCIFDWNWDAKRVLRNICTPQFLQAMQLLEHEAEVILFETEGILQQLYLDFERKESRDVFGWAKWITPLISAVISFVLSIFVMGFVRQYLHAQKNRQRRPTKPSHPETARIQGDFAPAPPPPVYRSEVPVTYFHRL